MRQRLKQEDCKGISWTGPSKPRERSHLRTGMKEALSPNSQTDSPLKPALGRSSAATQWSFPRKDINCNTFLGDRDFRPQGGCSVGYLVPLQGRARLGGTWVWGLTRQEAPGQNTRPAPPALPPTRLDPGSREGRTRVRPARAAPTDRRGGG